MKAYRSSILLIVAALFLVIRPAAASDKNVVGLWQGVLKVQTIELRIVFHVAKDSAGILRATMDSPDQGAKGIPVENVTIIADSLSLLSKLVGGGFSGAIQPGDSVIKGNWTQNGITIPLDLHRIGQIAVTRHPQEPMPPYPYSVEEVSYQNSAAGITLGGTLTKPNSAGPFPALLLITGSGAQNRDEELLGHKPFLILADYLTRKGIAVLRVDDRGVGKSTGVFKTATSEDFAGDVRSGIKYLQSRKDINTKKIGLLGHSEGGIIAPMVASSSKDVAFIVLMAGPSLPGDQILILQDSLISGVMGVPYDRVKQALQLNRKLFALVKTITDTTSLRKQTRSLMEEAMRADTSTGGRIDSAAVTATVNELSSPWFRYFITYDPAPALEHVACPVLAINGSKDLQVPANENIAGMNAAFKKSGNKRAIAMILPGLNHLLQKAETGAPAEYAKIEETINSDALKVIGDWISEVTR